MLEAAAQDEDELSTDDILKSFQPYHQIVELADISDPDLIFDRFDKLRAAGILLWHEVEQFREAFL